MSVLIKPGSPEHARIISPSKVAAILGVSRFESPYRLWHRMKGLVPPEPPKDIFRAGHAMEHALAHLWKEENEGWQLSPGEVQIRRDDLPFPAVTTLDRRARRGSSRRNVQFKTARDLSEWGDDFTDDAPVDYVVQVIAEQIISGYADQPSHLMVMGPWFNWHTYVIPYDKHVAAALIDRCAEFWRSLELDTPPLLDDSVATYECVRKLHADLIVDTEIQLDADLADEFLDADLSYKAAKVRLTGVKTQVLERMKNTHVAKVGDVKVAGRQNNGHGSISLVAKHPKKKSTKGSTAA